MLARRRPLDRLHRCQSAQERASDLAINARDGARWGPSDIETTNPRSTQPIPRSRDDVVPGDYVVIEVSDTGSVCRPMPRRRRGSVLCDEPVVEYTSLGPSMTDGFASARGPLRIYSEAGHGTTVKLYLPRALQDDRFAKAREERPRGQGEMILVVEDDATVRLIRLMSWRNWATTSPASDAVRRSPFCNQIARLI